MPLDKFVNCTNDLLDFESVHSETRAEDSVHALEILRVELDSLWTQTKRAYEICRDLKVGPDDKPIDKTKLRDRYKKALTAYKCCAASINAELQVLTYSATPKSDNRLSSNQATLDNNTVSYMRLPQCDMDPFYGNPTKWPTFRDLFTAICLRSDKMGKIEKLIYLKQKIGGDANIVLGNIPMTNEGFDLAWDRLLRRYDNKREQVNAQLRILFDLPNVSVDSAASVQKLQSTANGVLETLDSLKIKHCCWDPIMVFICQIKLPRIFVEEFENTLDDCAEIPNWTQFDKFLTKKFKTLQSSVNIKATKLPDVQSQSENKPSTKGKKVHSLQINTTQIKNESNHKTHSKPNKRGNRNYFNAICPHCKESHLLRKCPKFLNSNVNDKIQIARVANVCFNCLGANHSATDCKSQYSCRFCDQKHNTLLHTGIEPQSSALVQQNSAMRPINNAAALTSNIQSTLHSNSTIPMAKALTLRAKPPNNKETLLFTAMVDIEINGHRYQARAIIDPGSQTTFISDKLKKKLALPSTRNPLQFSGMTDDSGTSVKACLFNLCSRVDPNFRLEVWAQVVKDMKLLLPTQTLDVTDLSEAAELELADPHFYQSRPVDLVIGLDIGKFIFCLETPMRIVGPLLAHKTVFGWVVGGSTNTPNTIQESNAVSLLNTKSLDQTLTRFWEVEETPKKILRSDEDIFCEKNFQSTTRRIENGRYLVTLPFKNDKELGNSRNIAMAQYLRMERILNQKPDIKKQYDQVISEYLELGHMKKLSPLDIQKTPNYYLPHHAIIKPDRLTTKLRVVFNASCPSSNKRSLNDILHPGPILQQDLVLQILKWRFFRFVFNADITKMYRQILIDPSQTKYQRILFRRSINDPIEDFELLTVTFGVNCAPFLAIRTLLQIAEDFKSTHPLASHILKENMYVDDVLAGGHTLNDAIKSRRELSTVLKSAGFDLMKWTSNDPRVIQDLPTETLLPLDWLNLSENAGTKTLGIKWSISLDSFTFTAPEIEIKQNYTKREVLSTIAKFFDPCGWLAPIIVDAKLIMQHIWLDKIDWDEILKTLTCIKWQKFVQNCPSINNLKIPRWIQYSPSCDVELHGFCDASEKAYSAALYIRTQLPNNSVHTFLLAAKTRVAPIKKVSLPRLELCGSVLLASLTSAILPHLQISTLKTYFWTDSTIVLAWLKKPPCSWNTFVGNRVSEISQKVGTKNWQHIESKENPADVASRGCTPRELESHHLWWFGPTWLKNPKNQWPVPVTPQETTVEAKTVKTLTTTTYEDPLSRFSSLPRAYRVLAYVFRFWRNTGTNRTHLRISSRDITTEEIKAVKNRLIILTQKHAFPDDYQKLSQKVKISPRSSLLTLNPFIDSLGIIRANGRLVQSPALTYNERHPILLPYDSKLSRLITEFTHKITLHGGNQLMIRVLRTEFWIFRLKPLVKNVIYNCTTCVLFKKQTQNQIMASLPPERTNLSRPFETTGVDYAGPFDIRSFTGRACLITKGYVCVFVCFTTKAIHLEAASDLSAQAFLAAFARFIGRRGCPALVYSDNGTNFVGAAELIKRDRLEFMKNLQTQVLHHYSHQNLDWKFIPPGAPHMGGLWEAGVKSFKTHLRKMIPNMKFTFEELSTILTRIESCLNSRPLSPASDDPNDLSPLTPGHFLIGAPLMTSAEPDLSGENLTLVNRWKRLRIIYHSFCQRWKSEYLTELHRRYKWKNQKENVKVNDMVVIKDNNLPPNEWKLGRIVKTYLGVDQNSRVVDIRTSNGICTRPISKIVVLYTN